MTGRPPAHRRTCEDTHQKTTRKNNKASHDVSPKAEGPEADIEHAQFQPIDAQTNGPQIFYGLLYHLRVVKPNEVRRCGAAV